VARDTERLRAIALKVASDKGLDPQRIEGRKEQYKLADGRIVRLRTTSTGSLVSKADGPEVEATTYLERGDDTHVLISVLNRAMVDVYLVEKLFIVGGMRQAHEVHLMNNPERINSPNANVRSITFDDDLSDVGRGFRVHCRENLIGRAAFVDDVIEGGPNGNELVQTMLDRWAREAARAFDCELSRVRVQIGIGLASGELCLNWNPSAPALDEAG
jgi:hypothetical protein